ncbi:hypothetical protein ACET3Z_010762 [Daucus carota]
MARYFDLNDQFAGLDIEEEENSAFVIEGEGVTDGNKKAGGPVRSRYLREEDDTEWEARQGRYTSGPKSGGGCYGNIDNNMILGNAARQDNRNHGDNANPVVAATSYMESRREGLNLEMRGENLNFEDGLDNDEMTGLLITDRKRMRGGPDNYDTMDTLGDLGKITDSTLSIQQKDVGLSVTDCTTSNNSQLAKLAKQASRTP